jgi:hypothetical protein
MDKNKKDTSKLALIIGVVGTVVGIFLVFLEQSFIGVAGTVARAGVAVKGHIDPN